MFFDAPSTVEARFGFTHRLPCFTVSPSPSFDASASIIIHQLDAVAGPGPEAWPGQTFINIRLTAGTGEPIRTDTLVTAHPVHTRSAVDAG